MKIVELYEAQEELQTLWSTLPDATLQRLSVSFCLSADGKLEITAGSTVAFNYLRRQRNMIEHELTDFMTKHSVKELQITQG